MAAKNQTEVKTKHYHYSGKEKDKCTGLDDYGMRYYAPWLGRWTSTDPAGTVDGLNLYAFVAGNPVTHEDVGGRVSACAQVFLYAAVLSIIFAIVGFGIRELVSLNRPSSPPFPHKVTTNATTNATRNATTTATPGAGGPSAGRGGWAGGGGLIGAVVGLMWGVTRNGGRKKTRVTEEEDTGGSVPLLVRRRGGGADPVGPVGGCGLESPASPAG